MSNTSKVVVNYNELSLQYICHHKMIIGRLNSIVGKYFKKLSGRSKL